MCWQNFLIIPQSGSMTCCLDQMDGPSSPHSARRADSGSRRPSRTGAKTPSIGRGIAKLVPTMATRRTCRVFAGVRTVTSFLFLKISMASLIATLARSAFGLGEYVPQVGDAIQMRIIAQGAEAKAYADYLRAHPPKK